MAIFPDGRELDYDLVSSTEPEWEGEFSIEETWIDAEGKHWYKGSGAWGGIQPRSNWGSRFNPMARPPAGDQP